MLENTKKWLVSLVIILTLVSVPMISFAQEAQEELLSVTQEEVQTKDTVIYSEDGSSEADVVSEEVSILSEADADEDAAEEENLTVTEESLLNTGDFDKPEISEEAVALFEEDADTHQDKPETKNGFSNAQAPKLQNLKKGVKISWEKMKNAKGYRVFRRKAGTSKWKTIKDVSGLTYNDSKVKTGQTYDYLVLPYKTVKGSRLYGGFDETSHASICFLTTPAMKSIGSKDGGLLLSWKKVKGASFYKIYRRTKTKGAWKLIAKTDTLSYSDKKITQGKRYEYSVAACKGTDRSVYAVNKIKGLYLAAPKKLKAKASSLGTVISWKKVPQATSYRVYRKTATGKWKRLITTKETKYTDRKYKAGRVYYYMVRAYSSKAEKCGGAFSETGKKAKAKTLKVSYKKNGKTYMYLDGYLGISRSDLLAQLGKHEKDQYYRGTPPRTNDNRNSYGDPNHTYGSGDSYGVPGFNCTGFVWRALYDSGANPKKIPLLRGGTNCWQNPKGTGNNTWNRFIQGDDGTTPVHYRFNSVKELLKSGKAEKGDIIYCRQTGQPSPITGIVDSHVGIFYGDTPSDNKFFHCGPLTFYGGRSACGISEINPGSPSTIFLVKWMPGK